jgi:hypothetical protein
MFGSLSRKTARRSIFVGVAVSAAALLGIGYAVADVPVNLWLNWSGVYPVIGKVDPVTVGEAFTLPSPVTVGQRSADFPVTVHLTAPPLAGTAMRDVQAATIAGSAQITITGTDSAGVVYSEVITMTAAPTPAPALGAALDITATGTAYVPAIAHAGPITLNVEPTVPTTIHLAKADGSDTVLPTFAVTVRLDQTGPSQNPSNNPVVGTVIVEPAS